MPTVQQLVTAVIEDGNFDVSEDRALAWLDARHALMVVRARSLRVSEEIGPTVVDQQTYDLPSDVVQIFSVTVDGVPQGNLANEDLPNANRGFLLLSGDGQAIAPSEDSDGDGMVALVPVPSTAGLSVVLRAARRPPALVIGDESTLRIPTEFCDALIAGAIATGLLRSEQRPDLAANFEQIFGGGAEEFRVQTARKYRGAGPAQIRVQGINA